MRAQLGVLKEQMSHSEVGSVVGVPLARSRPDVFISVQTGDVGLRNLMEYSVDT